VPDTQNIRFVANDFVPNNVRIDQRPFAKIVADRASPIRKGLEAVTGLYQAGCYVAG
jgi:hypothetical protein